MHERPAFSHRRQYPALALGVRITLSDPHQTFSNPGFTFSHRLDAHPVNVNTPVPGFGATHIPRTPDPQVQLDGSSAGWYALEAEAGQLGPKYRVRGVRPGASGRSR